MLAPERRTRGDLVAAVAIVLAIAVAATVIWWTSDARGTTSITAEAPAPEPPRAMSVPGEVQELWRAPNGALTVPLVADGAVVTAADDTVTGHDRATGAEIWSYERDVPLCGVVTAWDKAVAVYRDARGCSEVTALRGADGSRDAQRDAAGDEPLTLSADSTYVLALGPDHVELWRWDLVRTVEYGKTDTSVAPDEQPRSGCTLTSAATSKDRLAVLERCPGDSADRLTIQNPAPKDAQLPEEYGSTVLIELVSAAEGTRVLAVAGDRTAAYLPGDGQQVQPRIGVFDGAANPVAQYPLSAPMQDDAIVAPYRTDFTVWTGPDLIMLDSATMAPRWTFPGALGPGVEMANAILVPVAGGIAVVDPRTGVERSRIAVDRGPSVPTPITLAVVGETILEQRNGEVVALGPKVAGQP